MPTLDWSTPQKISVAHLLEFYDPYAVLDLDKQAYLAQVWPSRGYAPMLSAARDAKDWHYGRIAHFVTALKAGIAVDPIEIDMTWEGCSCTGFVVLDGHHRLIAADISGAEITAMGSGVIGILDWLAGVHDTRPVF